MDTAQLINDNLTKLSPTLQSEVLDLDFSDSGLIEPVLFELGDWQWLKVLCYSVQLGKFRRKD